MIGEKGGKIIGNYSKVVMIKASWREALVMISLWLSGDSKTTIENRLMNTREVSVTPIPQFVYFIAKQ